MRDGPARETAVSDLAADAARSEKLYRYCHPSVENSGGSWFPRARGGHLTASDADVSFNEVMANDLSQRWILVLTSLADGPKHGYALIKDIEQFADVTLGPGTLYGALARLEEIGLVTPLPAQERRHPYEITAAGTAALTAQLRRDEQVARIGLARIGVQSA
jgi:DNA-binding PadR family transcriptional regulator